MGLQGPEGVGVVDGGQVEAGVLCFNEIPGCSFGVDLPGVSGLHCETAQVVWHTLLALYAVFGCSASSQVMGAQIVSSYTCACCFGFRIAALEDVKTTRLTVGA